MVPGDIAADRPFNFCLNELTEVDSVADTDGGSDTESGFGQPITGGGTSSDWDIFDITIGKDAYKVQTNPWNWPDEQTITAGGSNVMKVDSFSGGTVGTVTSFPSVYKGKAQDTNEPATTDSGMPIKLSDITSVYTGLSTNASSVNYTGNTTYDVYFTDSSTYNGGSPDKFLMVWLDSDSLNPIAADYSCGSDVPTYIDSCSSGSVIVNGKTFYVFIGSNGTADVISYAPATPMDEFEFDLNDFIDDAETRGVLSSTMYLQSIQAGFEISTNGAGLTIYDFYADVL
jgi:hypothetical protein